MTIIIRQSSTKQPSQPLYINRGHWLARGLREVFLPSAKRSMLGFSQFTLGANGVYAPSPQGLTVGNTARTANVGSFALNLSYTPVVCVTAVMMVRDLYTSGLNFDMFWELTADAATNNGGFSLYNQGSSSMIAVSKGTSTASTNQHTTASRPPLNRFFVISSRHLIGAASESDAASLFVNGVKDVRTSGTGITTGGNFANSTFNILSRNAASLPTSGQIACLLIHDRWISDAEFEQLRGPSSVWGLFERRIVIPYTATTGGATPTLSDLRAVNVGAISTQWSIDYTF